MTIDAVLKSKVYAILTKKRDSKHTINLKFIITGKHNSAIEILGPSCTKSFFVLAYVKYKQNSGFANIRGVFEAIELTPIILVIFFCLT